MVVRCGLKIQYKGNCSASRGKLRDAEQLSPPPVTEFSIRTKQQKYSFSCILFLQRLYVSLNMRYQLCITISTFAIKNCSVWLLSSTSWCHARGRLALPCIRRKYPKCVKIVKKPCRVCKNLCISPFFELSLFPQEWQVTFVSLTFSQKSDWQVSVWALILPLPMKRIKQSIANNFKSFF